MQEIIANSDGMAFDVEMALEQQLGAQPLPFPGMDKSGAAICVYFLSRSCTKENACPFRHVSGEKSVVCKHWLRGLCKKGDQCEFLHEYCLSKMPECYFFSKYNACSNKECPFRHIDPESKIKDCPWYDRGFCRNGPSCKHRHRRRVICLAYMNGFCIDGPNCTFSHPSFDLPQLDPQETRYRRSGSLIVCHHCGELGHKITNCPKLPQGIASRPGETFQVPQDQRAKPITEITCYKCGEKGHYANKCAKGHLAFLSQSAHLTQEIRQRDEIEKQRTQMLGTRRAGEMLR